MSVNAVLAARHLSPLSIACESIDYSALAQQGLTLVFYMGLARSQDIQRDLLNRGVLAALPAAIIERASYPDARVLRTTLGELSDCVLKNAVQSPALLVLGQVAAQQAVAAGLDFGSLNEIVAQHLAAGTPSDPQVRCG